MPGVSIWELWPWAVSQVHLFFMSSMNTSIVCCQVQFVNVEVKIWMTDILQGGKCLCVGSAWVGVNVLHSCLFDAAWEKWPKWLWQQTNILATAKQYLHNIKAFSVSQVPVITFRVHGGWDKPQLGRGACLASERFYSVHCHAQKLRRGGRIEQLIFWLGTVCVLVLNGTWWVTVFA